MAALTTAEVRSALRLTSTAFDAEIAGLMAAAEENMKAAGLTADTRAEQKELADAAVILFCKSHFGRLEATEADRLDRAYENLVRQLAITRPTDTEEGGDGDGTD